MKDEILKMSFTKDKCYLACVAVESHWSLSLQQKNS